MSLVPIFSRVLNAQYIKNIKFEIVNGYESERTLLGKEETGDSRKQLGYSASRISRRKGREVRKGGTSSADFQKGAWQKLWEPLPWRKPCCG